MKGKKGLGAIMKAHMEELGHFRTPKDLVFLLSKNLFHGEFWFFRVQKISHKVRIFDCCFNVKF